MEPDRSWQSFLPRCQFRLKTLVLGTTAVAIWLGVISERARRQRAVTAALSEVHASLLYDFQFDGEKLRLDRQGHAVSRSTLPGYAGLRSWLGDDYFVNIVDVRLDGMLHASISAWKAPYADRINATLLRQLGDLPKLRSLNLQSVNVTAEGWAQVGRLARLESLQLGMMNSTEPQSAVPFPAELSRLPRLKKIYLGRLPVTNDHLRRISSLPRLESLTLRGMNLAQVSLANLAGAPRLEELRLVLVTLGADTFAGMTGVPSLKSLRIAGGPLGDAEFAGIGTISSLERLQVGSNKISGTGWRHLRRLRQLKHLSLSHIDDAGMVAVSGLDKLETLVICSKRLGASQPEPWTSLTRLRSLSLTNSAVDDAGLLNVARLTNLEDLNLEGTRITDAGVAELERMTRLRGLNLRRTLVTPGGIAKLQRALPNCRIQR